MTLFKLSKEMLVSDAPTDADLPRLVAEGVRTIVDLRSDGEPRPRGIAPWDEARWAAALGIAYRQIPVEPPSLGDHLGNRVRRAIRGATPPTLLHCTTGRRAGVFGLIVIACAEHLSLDACLDRGRALGLDFDGMPRLRAFLEDYLARHAEAFQAADPKAELPRW
jgi:uncharacterized protein (TIGR01244 family)